MNYLKPTDSPAWRILYIILVGAVMLAPMLVSPVVKAEEPGTLKWKYETGDNIRTVPAIDDNGTIYVGSEDNYLYAINPDGTLKWRYQTGDYIPSPPSISEDGTIYVGSHDSYLYAINPDGTLKWRFNTGMNRGSSPAISEKGTIYVGSHDSYLYAINPDGTLKWRYQTGRRICTSPAIGKNGTIYVGSLDSYLYAINPDGTLKWRYKTEDFWVTSPAIGSENTIDVGSSDKHLYAINPDGSLKWRLKTAGKITRSPVLGNNSIYVGTTGNYLYAINPSGTLDWKYDAGGIVQSIPAIGRDGTIYINSRDQHTYALTESGELKWRTGIPSPIGGVTLGISGILYTNGGFGLLAINTENLGLADSPWPVFGDNLRNTSRAGTEMVKKVELIVQVTDSSGSSLDAKVYFDGEYRGDTGWNGKYTVSDLSSGSYTIRTEKEGYSSNSVTIHLSPGEKEELTLALEEKNKPPIASFDFSPNNPKTNQKVDFNSNSSDSDGTIDEYNWTFGDGSSSSLRNPNHTYEKPGTYEVKLKVTDNDGATDSTTKQVTVENRKPIAKFTYSPEEPKAGQQVTFDATSARDLDGSIENFEWDLTGDGSFEESGSEVTYEYEKEGTYEVELTVTDDYGDSVSTTQEIKVTKEEVKIGEKHALVVGISDYKHDSVRDLKYAQKDAENFYQYLISDSYEEFPEENTTLLTDEDATTQAVEDEMRELVTDVGENDLVIIYYSGHGAPGPDYNGDEDDGYDEYFVTYDTDTSSGAKLYSTGIIDDQFGNWLASMDSKHVAIFIESCYSGGATKSAKGTSIPGQEALLNNEVFNDFSFDNRLLFAASSENQPSWESPELNQGVFTHFLLQGLKGKADKNNDGQVTSDELYDYLKPQVSSYVDEHFNSTQTPLMKGAISVPLSEKKEKLEGQVKYVKGQQKDRADKGEYVVINLGAEDGVNIDDRFKVFYSPTKGVVFENLQGVLKVEEVIGPHLAICKLLDSEFSVTQGDKVEKVNE